MLIRTKPMTSGRPTSQAGFTLVELLVAMMAGAIVVFAAFSIEFMAIDATQHISTRVDASRQGRLAFETIENELHSACVGGSTTYPIQGVTGGITESDANDLVFLSYYGAASAPTPVWHRIAFNALADTLTDSSYAVTGSGPNWSQGTLIGTATLLTNVSQMGATPVFQYYAYTQEYTDGSGYTTMMIPDGTTVNPTTGQLIANDSLPTASGLSETDAQRTVEVVINLTVESSGVAGTDTTPSQAANPMTDAISLRLTPPPNDLATGVTAASYGPCQ